MDWSWCQFRSICSKFREHGIQRSETQPLVYMKKYRSYSRQLMLWNHRSRMSDLFWPKACTDTVASQRDSLPITLGAVLVCSLSVLHKCCSAFYFHRCPLQRSNIAPRVEFALWRAATCWNSGGALMIVTELAFGSTTDCSVVWCATAAALEQCPMRHSLYACKAFTKVSQMGSITIPLIHMYVLSCSCFANAVHSMARCQSYVTFFLC